MKITISNVFGAMNRGDALLIEALHASLRTAFGPNAEFSGIAQLPEVEANHLSDVRWSQPPARCYLPNRWIQRPVNAYRAFGSLAYSFAGAPEFWPLLSPPASQRASIRAIHEADLVVSCPGGFLIGNNPAVAANILQLHIANRTGRNLIIAPQTIGPINNRVMRGLALRELERAGLICAREGYTYDYLIDDLGIDPAKVLRTTDIALEHERVDEEGGDAALAAYGLGGGTPFIGTTLVDWYFPFADDPAKAKASYRERILATLRALQQRTGLPIVIFNQVSRDIDLSKDVCAALGEAAFFDREDRTPAVMRGMIRQARIFLGSRFHSCVFALLSRVPTVALAYSYKSTGIMEDLGLGDRVLDINSFEPEPLVDMLARMLETSEAESRRIDTALRELAYPRFADVLTDFVGKSMAAAEKRQVSIA